jgi:hypothetical protein
MQLLRGADFDAENIKMNINGVLLIIDHVSTVIKKSLGCCYVQPTYSQPL